MEQESRINILLIDDREENLISLAAVLEQPNYRLIKANSGQEALRLLLNEDFALILLDVQMPIMDGFETATLIKQREKSKDIPIIFITANNADVPLVFKGYASGGVDYLSKPFEPTALRSKVAVFAELHRKNLLERKQAELILKNERLAQEKAIAVVEMEKLRFQTILNQKYRDLVDGIEHGIVWIADAETKSLTFVSEQIITLLGSSPEELIDQGLTWRDLVHPHDRSKLDSTFESLGPAEIRFDHRCIVRDGSERWFQTSIRLIPQNEFGVPEVRGLSVDITHSKVAEQVAKAAVSIRDEFICIASHELKTPLTALYLQVQMLHRMIHLKMASEKIVEKLNPMLAVSDRQLKRLSQLIDELLDVSQMNNGKVALELSRLDLKELIQEVIERYQESLKVSGCHLKLEIESGLVGDWDRLRVEQIFANLLTNAMKYGDSKPIEVKVFQKSLSAVIEVKDHGIGIAQEDQSRIFEQFERASQKVEISGLGLGLYIARQLARAHQGDIAVESIPGKGSTFSLTLPFKPTFSTSFCLEQKLA